MCLIITGKASKVRSTLLETHGLLEDIYRKNPDGVGLMYATAKKGLRVVKELPRNVGEAEQLVARIPRDSRMLAIHFRWKTHGDIDLENCHPYPILPGSLAMMHNGVLRTGNSKNTKKSDTWHFIEDYLKNIALKCPDVIYDPGFLGMCQDFIGSSNKFVFMNERGQIAILNKKSGIEADDLWFSNTYAWTPSRFIKDYDKGYSYSYGGGYSYSGGYGYSRGSVYSGSSMEDDYWDALEREQAKGAKWSARDSISTGKQEAKKEATAKAEEKMVTAGKGDGGAKSTAVERFPNNVFSLPASRAHRDPVIDDDTQHDRVFNEAARSAQAEWLRDQKAGGAAKKGERVVDAEDLTGLPTDDDLVEVVYAGDDVWMANFLSEAPAYTIERLFRLMCPHASRYTPRSDLSHMELMIYDDLLAGRVKDVIKFAERSEKAADIVADVICLYLDWRPLPTLVAEGTRTVSSKDCVVVDGDIKPIKVIEVKPDTPIEPPTAA